MYTNRILNCKFIIFYIYCHSMGKNLILGLLTSILIISAFMISNKVEQKDEYSTWKQQFGKIYSPIEDAYRKIIFANNLKRFAEHNSDPTK